MLILYVKFKRFSCFRLGYTADVLQKCCKTSLTGVTACWTFNVVSHWAIQRRQFFILFLTLCSTYYVCCACVCLEHDIK